MFVVVFPVPNQQSFDVGRVKIRGVKTRGTQLTSKIIRSIHTAKPRGWNDDESGPPGSLPYL